MGLAHVFIIPISRLVSCSSYADLQRDFEPTGWLGMMLGTSLYYDLSSGISQPLFEKLSTAIGSVVHPTAAPASPSGPRLSRDITVVRSSRQLATMSIDEVAGWAMELDFFADELRRHELDGPALGDLVRTCTTAQDTIALSVALGLSLGRTLALLRAARALESES